MRVTSASIAPRSHSASAAGSVKSGSIAPTKATAGATISGTRASTGACVSWTVQVPEGAQVGGVLHRGAQVRDVLVEPRRLGAAVEVAAVVRRPDGAAPRAGEQHALEAVHDGDGDRGHRALAQERAGEDEAGDEVGPLGGGPAGGAGAHRVADEDRRAAQVLDERERVLAGHDVAVGAERGVRVAVAAQVEHGDAVAGVGERAGELAPGAAQVSHAGDEDDERAVRGPVDRVGDPPLGALQVLDGCHERKANAISQRRQPLGATGVGRAWQDGARTVIH